MLVAVDDAPPIAGIVLGLFSGAAIPVALLALLLVLVALQRGGYYAESWGVPTIVCGWVVAIVALLSNRQRLRRMELVQLASFAALGALTLLSAVWASGGLGSALPQAQRLALVVAALAAVLMLFRRATPLLATLWACLCRGFRSWPSTRVCSLTASRATASTAIGSRGRSATGTASACGLPWDCCSGSFSPGAPAGSRYGRWRRRRVPFRVRQRCTSRLARGVDCARVRPSCRHCGRPAQARVHGVDGAFCPLAGDWRDPRLTRARGHQPDTNARASPRRRSLSRRLARRPLARRSRGGRVTRARRAALAGSRIGAIRVRRRSGRRLRAWSLRCHGALRCPLDDRLESRPSLRCAAQWRRRRRSQPTPVRSLEQRPH